MAYFRNNENERTQSISYGNAGTEQQGGRTGWTETEPADWENDYDDGYDDSYDDSYDDGFDQLTDDGMEEDVYEDDEEREVRKVRLQTIFDVSNLTATIIGALLILLLLQLLFSMIDYVKTDFELNFSLLMSRI